MDPFYHCCYVFVCHTVLSAPCSLVITCWEKADFLALSYVMLFCVFVPFPYVLGQVLHLVYRFLFFLPSFKRLKQLR